MSEDRPSNRMLAALSKGDVLRWGGHLQPVELPARHELYAAGAELSHVYFPTTALIALLQPAQGVCDVPVALVGDDGALGAAALLGAFAESSRAVVLHPGVVWQLPISVLAEDHLDSAHVARVVLTYLHALTTQMAQTALCQRVHTVEQRLCRWMLMAFERTPGDVLAVDLSDLTGLLNVPADALAGAAALLVASGAMAFEPGRLRLLDRQALQAQACDCQARVSTSTS